MSQNIGVGHLIVYNLNVALFLFSICCLVRLSKIRNPRFLLAFWHLVLLICLMAPVLHWQVSNIPRVKSLTEALVSSVPMNVSLSHFVPVFEPIWNGPRLFPKLLVFARWSLYGGVIISIVLFVFGLIGLYRIRNSAIRLFFPVPLEELKDNFKPETRLYLSDRVQCPVTIGFIRPVILLPHSFLTIPLVSQRAVLFHELLHIKRKDWLLICGEQLVCSFFWFNPALKWLFNKIHLAREQVIDFEVIRRFPSAKAYVEGMLAFSAGKPHGFQAASSLFPRRDHLKIRIRSILNHGQTAGHRPLVAIFLVSCAVMLGAGFVALPYSFSNMNEWPEKTAEQAATPNKGLSLTMPVMQANSPLKIISVVSTFDFLFEKITVANNSGKAIKSITFSTMLRSRDPLNSRWKFLGEKKIRSPLQPGGEATLDAFLLKTSEVWAQAEKEFQGSAEVALWVAAEEFDSTR
jgi:beta-lactamase regulating signal transducer with metallopeptidase domain